MSRYTPLWEYIGAQTEPSLSLTFAEIEQIAGIPIDHSFLTCKKELTAYGWRVGKISMKAKHISFVRENHEGEPL